MANRLQRWQVSYVLKPVLLGMLAVFLAVACGGKTANNLTNDQNQPLSHSAQNQCQTIEHDFGKTEVCRQPQKVAVLGSNMLETILALQVQPVGYADYLSFHRADFDRPSRQIPYLGRRVTSQPINLGTSGEPSLEALTRLKPDLILGNVEQHRDKYALLSKIAPTLLFRWARQGVDWQPSFQVIARALGRTEQAQKVIEVHNQQLAVTREKLAPVVAAHPTVLMLDTNGLNQYLQLSGSASPCGRLIDKLGFRLVSFNKQKMQSSYQRVSLENLPQFESDLIVVEGYDFSQPEQLADAKNIETHQLQGIKQEWSENAIAQSLPASQEGRVYFVSSYLCNGLPGPIGAEIFLDELQKQLLPEDAKSGES
ncbi:iron-siderophore ABC transporter substrate-binding protein [Pleurocapsales cyanobacterium LEGE 06147]|nr:iron-siderophore ABC transporter substrate-binding protein [Pleurocapsales cyanobacterium LEGE 06147]